MARVLYLDCFSGAAGDMLLGALIDAGVPAAEVQAALGSLGVEHELRISRVMRAGVACARVEVLERSPAADAGQRSGTESDPHHHDHDHHHHHHDHDRHGHDHDHVDGGHGHSHHEHRPSQHHHHHHGGKAHAHGHHSLEEISRYIRRSALSRAAKDRAVALFGRLAEAEAAIHDMPIDQVHLHEVGALDSIIDIVGVVFAMEWLGIDDVVSSPLNVGGGTVEIAHGQFPVPAPATARLLAGVPIYSRDPQVELVTPTGALLVSAFAKRYGPMPAMTISRVGYGAGARDFERVPNALRVFVGESIPVADAPAGDDVVVKMECEIDDMNPQLFGPASDRLFEAGALDVFLTPVQMKKGRPGTLVTVLAPEDRQAAVSNVLFRETTTLGVRFARMQRETLDRRIEDVTLPGGLVRIKVSGRQGMVLNAVPEFDDCVRVATSTGRPVKDVQADALQAWRQRG